MKKKRILIAFIIFILITCIVTAVFIIKNKNRSTSNTVYTYSNVNRIITTLRIMYYILMAREYCILLIQYPARTLSIVTSQTAHMKDTHAQIRILHALQLFMDCQKLER